MQQFAAYLLGTVELTGERWRHIVTFHPEIRTRRADLARALRAPDTVRKSAYDPSVLIFYRRMRGGKYLAVAVKNDRRKFILTAYVTKRIQHLPL